MSTVFTTLPKKKIGAEGGHVPPSPPTKSATESQQNRTYFLLRYQSVVLSVIDYGLGLTKMPQTNLLKQDRVQSEAMSHIANHQGHTH